MIGVWLTADLSEILINGWSELRSVHTFAARFFAIMSMRQIVPGTNFYPPSLRDVTSEGRTSAAVALYPVAPFLPMPATYYVAAFLKSYYTLHAPLLVHPPRALMDQWTLAGDSFACVAYAALYLMHATIPQILSRFAGPYVQMSNTSLRCPPAVRNVFPRPLNFVPRVLPASSAYLNTYAFLAPPFFMQLCFPNFHQAAPVQTLFYRGPPTPALFPANVPALPAL